jgi:hypothetical protein
MMCVLALLFMAVVIGVCLFAGYHSGYGEGFNDAMDENREEHYLTD